MESAQSACENVHYEFKIISNPNLNSAIITIQCAPCNIIFLHNKCVMNTARTHCATTLTAKCVQKPIMFSEAVCSHMICFNYATLNLPLTHAFRRKHWLDHADPMATGFDQTKCVCCALI